MQTTLFQVCAPQNAPSVCITQGVKRAYDSVVDNTGKKRVRSVSNIWLVHCAHHNASSAHTTIPETTPTRKFRSKTKRLNGQVGTPQLYERIKADVKHCT
eukprot:gb/GEZN01026837.1/.p1 GENE.gb/GEZN01026837.1/~~gb/GEZN01026837.1/.p1  ORF type:complete len:100 (+),score=4.78 gb/GEZN01026837.1/:116-415(+)